MVAGLQNQRAVENGGAEQERCGNAGRWTPVENSRLAGRAFRLDIEFPTVAHRPWKSQTARFPHFHSADGFSSLSLPQTKTHGSRPPGARQKDQARRPHCGRTASLLRLIQVRNQTPLKNRRIATGFEKSYCRSCRRYGITTLVPPQFRWPVLRCPSLAGFQVSPEVPANITPLTPKELARRAIESARGAAGAEQQDGSQLRPTRMSCCPPLPTATAFSIGGAHGDETAAHGAWSFGARASWMIIAMPQPTP